MPIILVSLFGPFINLATAIVNASGSILQGVVPLLQGVSSLFVWYVKELYSGFVTVFNNFSVVVLIATLVGGATAYAIRNERADCFLEVAKQRKYDEWKFSEIQKHATAPAAVTKARTRRSR